MKNTPATTPKPPVNTIEEKIDTIFSFLKNLENKFEVMQTKFEVMQNDADLQRTVLTELSGTVVNLQEQYRTPMPAKVPLNLNSLNSDHENDGRKRDREWDSSYSKDDEQRELKRLHMSGNRSSSYSSSYSSMAAANSNR
jgi:hypothetical protein